MNPKDWKKVKEIFNEAVELPEKERSAFLDVKFNGDKNLRLEVEKMLIADEEGFTGEEALLEKNVFEHFADTDLSPPEKIKDYKIIREIGRGGMGKVYEAVRETENFTHRVALKVIKRGMDTDAILSRFRHEQKILSSLEHQFIARFLDGGMTGDDLPFYAMEFVEGEFIDDYCGKNNLSVGERLKLFRKVCEAVQYAHQNLVIHRDLKPKNILVTKDGTPKLLDFGIGKILSPESVEEVGTATEFGMMTPAYASPEQIRGERIGTTSDIYSLGVILFELLTGGKPYKTETDSPVELQKAILETEPTKPSAIQNSKFKIQNPETLDKDIDNIILKTLRKNPNRRYSSVQEFSEDIRRHLEGLPVYARPLTLKYRAAKFFERNKISVIAGLLVFLSLITGISLAIWQAVEAQKAKQIAEKRFEEVRELANNVVFKYHDEIADLPGSTKARQMLVTDALKYLDNLAANSEENPELQKELARAYLKMADVQGKMYAANIGDTEGAAESYQKAIKLLENLVEKNRQDIEAKEVLIKAYDDFAFLALRTVEHGIAAGYVQKAINLHEEIIKTEPNNDKRTIQLIDLLIRLGDVNSETRPDGEQNIYGKLKHHQKALPLAEKLYESNQNFENAKILARVFQRIGTDYLWIGERAETRAEAEDAFPKALEFHKKSFAAVGKMLELDPNNNVTKTFQVAVVSNLAKSNAANGNFDEALEFANENLELTKKKIASDKANKESNLSLSIAYEVFAEIYKLKKEYQKSIEYRKMSLEVDTKIFRSDRQNAEALLRISEHHKELAGIYKVTDEKENEKVHRAKSQEMSAKLEELRK